MIVRKGKVEIKKHLKPHSRYLKPLTLTVFTASVTGCSDDNLYFFENVGECKKELNFNEAECISAYQIAEKKAQKSSFEYQTEKECFDDFGFGVCQLNDRKKYQPNNFGWVMSHAKTSQTSQVDYEMFIEPVYLSTNPRSSKFSYLMLTDKNGKNFYIEKYHLVNDAKVKKPRLAVFYKEILEKQNTGGYYSSTAGMITNNDWDDHRNYYSYNYPHNNSMSPPKVIKYKEPKLEDVKLHKTKSNKNFSFNSSKSVRGFGSTSRSKSSWGG
ncbi:DUF1190 domain-containing protein [Aliivibrio fischeri]|uniref:DUF1190 domain-containing protein n=1 Tax=Aliivibrio fischeri TaxID=668 RepID=UPI0007C49FF6|nr:DUF1190 domain-containing protein [Aliivibrio fischeri]MBP3140034.1 DUF1190 domain-containing protein [Aliivibrio fischeri]MBP3154415.1 DUF1190 domain-containing protein [Aliivibrio fischeri]MCE7572155.1 DUF1190 domain-containing protein [Aliivibrio fischeri]MUK94626.1 DUF1190 domain-containing protein [Aliivibrio fischeri]